MQGIFREKMSSQNTGGCVRGNLALVETHCLDSRGTNHVPTYSHVCPLIITTQQHTPYTYPAPTLSLASPLDSFIIYRALTFNLHFLPSKQHFSFSVDHNNNRLSILKLATVFPATVFTDRY